MSNPKDTDQTSEHKDHSQELADTNAEQIDKIASELEAKVMENPGVLERILDSPKIMAIAHESFRGPVPSPKMLSEYEQIMPGLANRLVKLTEDEQQHRHKVTDKALDFSYKKTEEGNGWGSSFPCSFWGWVCTSLPKEGCSSWNANNHKSCRVSFRFVIGRLKRNNKDN